MKKGLLFGFILAVLLLLVFTLLNSNESFQMVGKEAGKSVVEKEQNLKEKKVQKVTTPKVETRVQNSTTINGETESNEEKKLVEESKAEFNRITQEAEENVTALLGTAKKEVKVKKEDNMDLSIIPIKYEAILKEKEKEADSQFKVFLERLELDMHENNLPASMDEEYKREYKQKKLDRLLRLKEEINKLVM
ncbi:hypothetical protein [Robertmurraya korlensis]|uniref:hypothetical protein n=1 Tax=Robertmurraya korlensis TaxID=519977 RepID=UPI0008262029|nr:hypothetical protein [Robertmurraya korlensis]